MKISNKVCLLESRVFSSNSCLKTYRVSTCKFVYLRIIDSRRLFYTCRSKYNIVYGNILLLYEDNKYNT